MFYDSGQSIRPADIDRELFKSIIEKHKCEELTLKSQLRCCGGNDYIEYVKAVLEGRAEKRKEFADYELRLFDDANEMIVEVQNRDAEMGLCRTVAGYAWQWVSQKDKSASDIVFDGKGYQWNSKATDWINSEKATDEIGCIHTVQGYDLNVAGVILGNDVKYDPQNNKIVVDKANYMDSLGKTTDSDALEKYIINIYETLMTRGIKGTYVYACDGALREYLKKYF